MQQYVRVLLRVRDQYVVDLGIQILCSLNLLISEWVSRC